MHSNLRRILLVLLVSITLGACQRTPNHAKYIPKDAIAVAGLNAKSLGKKIAWNVITGSKLFEEMQKRLSGKSAKDAVSGIEKAGIDAANTFYVYIKPDTRFKGGNRITGLVPLDDAGKWEAYVKQVFPQAQIKQIGDRKEASLGSDMYVGWTKDLLIIINVMSASARVDEATGMQVASEMDKVDLQAEMDNAFKVSESNSIIKNPIFMKLEKENHDVAFFFNYDQLMTQYSANMAEQSGVSLAGSLWKDAAFTSGFDFEKGKIIGDMRYYTSKEMEEISKEMSRVNADKDMIERLPNQNMNMAIAMHISPKGIKSILEKTGLIGFVNIGLQNGGLNTDNVLDAFTGDMAIVMNDLNVKSETVVDSFLGQAVAHKSQKTNLTMSYLMKINNKEHFQQILTLATNNGLQRSGNGYVIPMTDKDSVYILVNDQYIAASNSSKNAAGMLAGTFKSQKISSAASSAIMNHPVAMFFDIQEMFKGIDPGISGSARDSVMIVESKKLLSNISVSGGEYKDKAFVTRLEVNFINTSENSILQLLDYGMRMNEADKIADAQ